MCIKLVFLVNYYHNQHYWDYIRQHEMRQCQQQSEKNTIYESTTNQRDKHQGTRFRSVSSAYLCKAAKSFHFIMLHCYEWS